MNGPGTFNKYPALFSPIKIGGLELKNRIVMPPITTNFPDKGFVTDRLISYYARRAEGGAGLIIIEDAIIDPPRGCYHYEDIHIDNDVYLPGLRALASAVKSAGASVAANLSHGGRKSGVVEDGQLIRSHGTIPVAPSAIADPFPGYIVPSELTIDEIEELEEKFVSAAARACEAGFDVISLHAAHMYLIDQFLSPISNHRDDLYGGDLDGRMRFLLEIIAKVRARAGSVPLMVRIDGQQYMPGGITVEEASEIARRLEAAGVDCLSVSIDPTGLGFLPLDPSVPQAASSWRGPWAAMVHLAEAVKRAVSIPMMTANRIVTPALAEEILVHGKADLIGIGRGLIADPDWPAKALEGRETSIRHCIGCLRCLDVTRDREALRCTVNPAAGRENDSQINPSSRRRKVFVAGAGPAGMEAARVAASRGHEVRLFEKDTLGGQLKLASIPPGKKDLGLLLDYEMGQLACLGVNIEMHELTAETIVQGRPDAVVVAVGSLSGRLMVPGSESGNVFDIRQVLKGEVEPGKRVVIIGGDQAGAETAEYLAQKGRIVTIVHEGRQIAGDMSGVCRLELLERLRRLGVRTMVKTKVNMVSPEGVIVETRGERRTLSADTVVTALPPEPEGALAGQLRGMNVKVHVIGDCSKIAGLAGAIEDGFRAGLKV
ncbi:MAG: FAD-dependent oxidoreductase [Chloroflexi bacterium]|nr:FAD-dependent oxidoreductase [Chloroflexota bacterium]